MLRLQNFGKICEKFSGIFWTYIWTLYLVKKNRTSNIGQPTNLPCPIFVPSCSTYLPKNGTSLMDVPLGKCMAIANWENYFKRLLCLRKFVICRAVKSASSCSLLLQNSLILLLWFFKKRCGIYSPAKEVVNTVYENV